MTLTTLGLIALAELLLIALLVVMFYVKKVKRLNAIIEDLKQRLTALSKKAKQLAAEAAKPPPPPPPPKPEPSLSYSDYLVEQLEMTRTFHSEQDGALDIALDLDPTAPEARRISALRHALLIAEKDAFKRDADNNDIDWQFLTDRYYQILELQCDTGEEEVATPSADLELPPMDDSLEEELDDTEELDSLREELETARKRIGNLEKFKALYFELESKWHEAKGEADEHYEELKQLAADTEQSEDFTGLIERYQSAYSGMHNVIINRVEGDEVVLDTEKTMSEIRRLRNMTTEQHHIIEELQEQLANERDGDEKIKLINNLRGEFKKQEKLLEESDTCIKLLEEELRSANSEIDSLRHKNRQVQRLSATIKDLEYNESKSQHIIQTLKSEKRKLAEQLKQMTGPQLAANASGGADTSKLEQAAAKALKDLKEMEAKYADLESRYLDLKLQE